MPAIDTSVQPSPRRALDAEGPSHSVSPPAPSATTPDAGDSFQPSASGAATTSPTRAPRAPSSQGSGGSVPEVRRAVGAAHARSGPSEALQLGDRCPAVEELQHALNAKGAVLDEDGVFGPKTASAVRDFQRERGLTVDGRVGPRTREALASTEAAPVMSPAAPQALTAGTVDAGTATRADIQAMRTSSDPATRRMASTVERAQRAFADTVARGGRVLVTTSAGNSGQPVVTVVPPGFDPTRPANVHTHYHGFNATVGDPKGHSSGTTLRIEREQRTDPQAVFVLPECANAQPGSYHSDWSNVRSQAQTTTDALASAGIGSVGMRTVSAHSGGGEALRRALQSRSDGSGVAADRLELQDCLYGSESAIAAWARTPGGAAARDVIFLHGTNTAGRDQQIARAFGDRYQRIDVPAGNGFDAHNRTVSWLAFGE